LENYSPIVIESPSLNEIQKRKLLGIFREYDDVFAKNEYDVGTVTVLKHKIILIDSRSIQQKSYRIPYAMEKDVDTQIKDMLTAGIIEPSSSPWESPTVLVNTLMVPYFFFTSTIGDAHGDELGYRRVNAVTRMDTYPIHIIEMMFDKIKKSIILSVMDLQKGYNQVEVSDESREITAFITNKGLYEYKKMPFGLTGA